MFDLWKSAQQKTLIVAHRGACGGNIPCNTMAAYEIALKQGADMIETDITMSKDGRLFLFHPGKENAHLCFDRRLEECTAEEISKLRYVNMDNMPTQFGLSTLDELLETFKGRCYINIDKFWDHPVEIAEVIRRHNMQDQVLVKSTLNERTLRVLEELAPDMPFMPIVRDSHPAHEELMKRNVRYVGVEVLFAKEDAEVASRDFVDRMHRDQKVVWVNPIIYNYKTQLVAGHSDDMAMTESMEGAWGWLVDRGYDLLQTDWIMMLHRFLNTR